MARPVNRERKAYYGDANAITRCMNRVEGDPSIPAETREELLEHLRRVLHLLLAPQAKPAPKLARKDKRATVNGTRA